MSAGTRETDYFGGGGSTGNTGMTDFPTAGAAPPGGAGRQSQQFGGGEQNTQQRYRFTQEEMKALRECNKESFYYRCLPIGTLMGCGAYYGVRYGYLKPSARFGAGPKMFFASIVGYFLGKFSYQSVCAEKLMALPNSQLGEVLRKKKGQYGFQDGLSMEPSFAIAAPVGTPAFPNSDLAQAQGNPQHSYSDVGDTRPMQGFDSEGASSNSGYDYNQPSSNYDTTHQMLDDQNLPPKRPQLATTSYDDLRRQNRIDYETRQFSKHQPSPPPPPPSAPAPDQRTLSQPNDGRPKNKYGDVWDDKPNNYQN